MAELKMPHPGHEKHLCLLQNTGHLEEHIPHENPKRPAVLPHSFLSQALLKSFLQVFTSSKSKIYHITF